MSVTRPSRRLLLGLLLTTMLVLSALTGLLVGATGTSASPVAVSLMAGGLGFAAAMPVFAAFMHHGVGSDPWSRRRFAAVGHGVSGTGSVAAIVGTGLVTRSVPWTLLVALVVAALVWVLVWTYRQLDRIRATEDVDRGAPGDAGRLEEALSPASIRRHRRRVLAVGLGVGLPVALSLLLGAAVLGSSGPRDIVALLSIAGLLGGLASTCVAGLSQGATLRAPLRAAGGDARLAREVATAIRRRRVERLEAAGAEQVAPVARALGASCARQAPGNVALLVLLASGFALQLTRDPVDPLLVAVTGAGVTLPIALVAWSRRERRLVRRFLAGHQPDPETAR